MAEPEAPRFLHTAPEPPPEPPPAAASPVGRVAAPVAPRPPPQAAPAPRPPFAAPPQTPIPPSKILPAPRPPRTAAPPAADRSLLAHYIQRRMPWFLRKFPRPVGVAFVVLGVFAVVEILRVHERGGMFLSSLPYGAGVSLGMGGWFTVTGYPTDLDGYPSSSWSLGYVSAIAASIVLGIALRVAFLT